MRHLTTFICLTLALLLGSMGMSWSADFNKGVDAYNRGDYATALREWKPLAEQGHADAQNNLGWMYDKGEGVPQDDKTAVKWFRLAAEQGLPLAQNNLSWMYRLGKSVPQNYKTAVKWYTLASEQGHAFAQFNLGLMYRRGQGVPQNDKTAVKWYTLAAKQGDARAQYNLGQMYRREQGVPQNDKTAVKWWKLSAEQGNASAQYNLGLMYEKGEGVPQNDKTAVKWWKLSAEQGNASAQYNLGVMYAFGQGVIQDNVYAHMWGNIAASNGEEKGEKLRDLVAKKMTPFQLEKAQKLARNFVPKKSTPVVIAKKPSPTVITKKTPEPKPANQVAKRTQPKPSPPPSKTGTSGSGFFVSKSGHVITNQHIVSDCGKVTVGDNAKNQVTADILETDRRNDLALLKISSMQMASADTKSLISKLGITVVPLASHGLLRSEDVELGERVLVAGYPYGDIFSNTIKVTGGMVSANRGLGDDTGQFQIDAAVQPGNSGGPIYDENGNIVGVVVAQLNKRKFEKIVGSIPENVNFGIKASTVRQFLTASGLPTKWSKRSKRMSTKQLAKIAKNQTVMVVCHP